MASGLVRVRETAVIGGQGSGVSRAVGRELQVPGDQEWPLALKLSTEI